MIILEEVAEPTKEVKFNGLTLRHLQPAHTRSTPSLLPDYATSEAQHRRDALIPSSKFKLDAKSWRAALIALCVYTFLTLTIAVPIIVLKSKSNKQEHNQYHQPPPASPVWPVDFTIPPPFRMAFGAPPSNESMTCNNWQTNLNSPNSVTASFQLPPSDCITIRSNATYNTITSDQLNGTLSVLMNENILEKTSILFTVELRSSEDIRDRTLICFDKEGDNKGLSIFIPSDIGDNNLEINISVRLPWVDDSKDDPKIDTFTAYLPMFSQNFGDLRYLSFSHFSLEGSHRPINSTYLRASQIVVTNALSSIQGSFNVTQSLSLESIRGSINASVVLSPSYDQIQQTTMNLGTGNSSLDTTSSIPPSSPNFAVQVINFDGPTQIDVAYGNTSLNSTLQMNVQNNFAPSIISMDGTFEGCFNVEAKLSQVSVQDTRKNASRTIDFHTLLPDIAMGRVSEDPKPPSYQDACFSFVNILSALGPVDLTFGH